jgi:MoaA/NifB/PqqE/SkfB family radical SAM enzyme
MSIEITRECPLHCPGCYAYDEAHLGGPLLRELSDYRGDALIQGVLGLVERHRPLHLSIVGGDPLVRHRELEVLLPILNQKGIFVQIVTSAYRPIPLSWATLDRANVVVSIDGLQPEHDERRKPATYERILKNIEGHQVIIHCTITGRMMERGGYLEDFLAFWSPRPAIRKIWMSMFTPQVGADTAECLSSTDRNLTVRELLRLRKLYPKLDMSEETIREFAAPPSSPSKCIFARTTNVISADLKTKVAPCQFGGNPDCSRCGCIASMGLAAVGHRRLIPGITAGLVCRTSLRIGEAISKLRPGRTRSPEPLPSNSPAI